MFFLPASVFAFFAKEFGAESFPVSAIGNDELGVKTMEALEKTGLNLDYIQCNGYPTSRVIVTMDEAGVPEYEIVEGVAWDALDCNEKTVALLAEADVVCWLRELRFRVKTFCGWWILRLSLALGSMTSIFVSTTSVAKLLRSLYDGQIS